jgi:hypothetical protein
MMLGPVGFAGLLSRRGEIAAARAADNQPAHARFGFKCLCQNTSLRHRPRAFPCGSHHNLGPARLHG